MKKGLYEGRVGSGRRQRVWQPENGVSFVDSICRIEFVQRVWACVCILYRRSR